jgi:hypothetical protein
LSEIAAGRKKTGVDQFDTLRAYLRKQRRRPGNGVDQYRIQPWPNPRVVIPEVVIVQLGFRIEVLSGKQFA